MFKFKSEFSENRRSHRPAPQSYRKLQARSKPAAKSVTASNGAGTDEAPTLKHLLLELQVSHISCDISLLFR